MKKSHFKLAFSDHSIDFIVMITAGTPHDYKETLYYSKMR